MCSTMGWSSLSPCCVYDFSSYPGRKYHIRVSEPGAKVVLSARIWWKCDFIHSVNFENSILVGKMILHSCDCHPRFAWATNFTLVLYNQHFRTCIEIYYFIVWVMHVVVSFECVKLNVRYVVCVIKRILANMCSGVALLFPVLRIIGTMFGNNGPKISHLQFWAGSECGTFGLALIKNSICNTCLLDLPILYLPSCVIYTINEQVEPSL